MSPSYSALAASSIGTNQIQRKISPWLYLANTAGDQTSPSSDNSTVKVELQMPP